MSHNSNRNPAINSMVRVALLVVAVMMVGLSSCDDGRIYSHFSAVDNVEWWRTDTVRFVVPPTGENVEAQTRLMLRISPDYEFRNLSLIVRTSSKAVGRKAIETTLRIDTIECPLSDDAGHIEGRGVFHRDFSFNIKSIPLSPNDTTIISVCHNMRRMEIAGIEDVGVELRR